MNILSPVLSRWAATMSRRRDNASGENLSTRSSYEIPTTLRASHTVRDSDSSDLLSPRQLSTAARVRSSLSGQR